MYTAIAQIDERTAELVNDQHGLFTRSFAAPGPAAPQNTGSWLGHVHQLIGWKNNLRNLIAEAKAMGCPVPQAAYDALKLGIPMNPMGRL